jgi:hypothetical protein
MADIQSLVPMVRQLPAVVPAAAAAAPAVAASPSINFAAPLLALGGDTDPKAQLFYALRNTFPGVPADKLTAYVDWGTAKNLSPADIAAAMDADGFQRGFYGQVKEAQAPIEPMWPSRTREIRSRPLPTSTPSPAPPSPSPGTLGGHRFIRRTMMIPADGGPPVLVREEEQ